MFKNRTLDHIGIASVDPENDVKFYCDVLGFEVAGQFGSCWFIKNGPVTYEIYESSDLPKDAIGKVDHVSYVSEDIEADYAYALEQGYTFATDGIQAIPHFWANGCRYFKILTPGGEQVEFNQIL